MPAERARRRRQVQERLGERLGERLPESRWREACRGRQPKRSGGNSGSRECDSPTTHVHSGEAFSAGCLPQSAFHFCFSPLHFDLTELARSLFVLLPAFLSSINQVNGGHTARVAGGVPSARRLARPRVPLHILVIPRPCFAWTALHRGALFGCACSTVADEDMCLLQKDVHHPLDVA